MTSQPTIDSVRAAEAETAAEPVGTHVRETLRLAWPVMIARSGILLIFTVDTVMTGRADAGELAFLGLGLAIQGVMMLVSIGLLQGSMVLSSQAYGAREFATCGRVWRVATLHALAIGAFFGVVCIFGEEMLLALGQDPALAAGGGVVSLHFGWGMPAMLLYVAATYLLESIQRPRIGMIVMLAANLLNIPLNAMLIYGWGGFFEPMGAAGAVIATSALRWAAAAAMILYILTLSFRVAGDAFAIRAPFGEWARLALTAGGGLGRRMRRLGAAVSLAYGLEAGAFSALVFMAGLIGPVALAAHQITTNAVAVMIMAAIGMAAATSVRVGNAVGRRDQPNMARAGWVGAALGSAFMILPAVLFLTAPLAIAAVYVADPEVLDVAFWTITIAGLFVVFDGAMNVVMGALRGAGDVWVPMGLHIVAFWVVGVPAAWMCAFTLELGAAGLQIGIAIAVALSMAAQMIRFRTISRRLIARA